MTIDSYMVAVCAFCFRKKNKYYIFLMLAKIRIKHEILNIYNNYRRMITDRREKELAVRQETRPNNVN